MQSQLKPMFFRTNQCPQQENICWFHKMNMHLLEDCHQFQLRLIVDLANKILLSLIQFAEMSHPLQNSY